MELKPGSRWRSAVCTAEAVVVRPPKAGASLECGGHPMTPLAGPRPEGLTATPEMSTGVAVGKRYFDEESGLEVLASKPGTGTLALDGRPLQLREAKALPSSD